MENSLLHLALLLIFAKLAEGLANRTGNSPLAAYVLVGLLLGPVIGVAPTGEHLGLFFEVGVVLLFFLVGVDEIDIAGFVRTIQKRILIAAIVAFAVPLAIGRTGRLLRAGLPDGDGDRVVRNPRAVQPRGGG